jgi:hypothetical protein
MLKFKAVLTRLTRGCKKGSIGSREPLLRYPIKKKIKKIRDPDTLTI